MTERTLIYDDLQIDPIDVYEQMGYHGTQPDEATRHEMQAVIAEVRTWLRPQFCFFVTPELPPFDMGNIILRQLRDAEAYTLFICTSGEAYEAYLDRKSVV